jgi:hypothetical protein
VKSRRKRITRLILAPLIYIAALLFLLEDWLWDIGVRLIARIAAWPPWARIERQIRALPPYGALFLFLMPAILLFPVKLLALYAITQGHALAGVIVILAAKIGGAAIVARFYSLTRPTLLSLPWFARWHDAFMDVKDRWVAALRASAAMRTIRLVAAAVRLQTNRAWADIKAMGSRRSQMRLLRGMRAPLRFLRRRINLWRSGRDR